MLKVGCAVGAESVERRVDMEISNSAANLKLTENTKAYLKT